MSTLNRSQARLPAREQFVTAEEVVPQEGDTGALERREPVGSPTGLLRGDLGQTAWYTGSSERLDIAPACATTGAAAGLVGDGTAQM